MKKILLLLIPTAALFGFDDASVVVQERSVIPEGSLTEAYVYTEKCIANRLDILNKRQHVLSSEEYDDNERVAIVSCADEMFVLFSETNYEVVSKGTFSPAKVICTADNIVGVDKCLRG